MAHKLKLIPLAAAAASLALIASPALASAPYTVAYDDAATGDHAVTATAKGNTVLSANGIDLNCTGSTLGLTVHAGTGSSGSNVATISSAAWTGCTASGFPATITATSPSWGLNLNSTNSQTSGLGDTLNGSISNVSNVSFDWNFGLFHCTYKLSGSVSSDQFLEDNGKGGQAIVISDSPGLTISNTSAGCLGWMNNGDAATINGEYNLSGQHINIS